MKRTEEKIHITGNLKKSIYVIWNFDNENDSIIYCI